MTELERRALLGDKAAQKQCVELKIVLQCPFCGNSKKFGVDAPNNKENIPIQILNDVDSDYDNFYLSCHVCGIYVEGKSFKEVLSKWNSRHTPPIGRCEDCVNLKRGGGGYGWCDGSPKPYYGFCDKFKHK